MTNSTTDLLPCPFCGELNIELIENGKMWTGMRYSEPVSISIRHFCPVLPGQPSRAIERIGRDLESAVAAWNQRPE